MQPFGAAGSPARRRHRRRRSRRHGARAARVPRVRVADVDGSCVGRLRALEGESRSCPWKAVDHPGR